MRTALVLAALAVVVCCMAEDRDDPTIVGGKIITCSGCKLNSLHLIRKFLHHDIATYPCIEVEYIPRQDPLLLLLNKYGRTVRTIDLTKHDGRPVQILFQEHGLHAWTPKPVYVPYPFTPTEHCVAWRQTAKCLPTGDREPMRDEDCNTVISRGRSGHCECAEGRQVWVACPHSPISCEDVCRGKSVRIVGDNAEVAAEL